VPHPSDLKIPDSQACEVCGQTLSAEPYWITSYPRGVHERCRDWSTIAFPYARDLVSLRRLVRRARRAGADLVSIGKRLAVIEREWPSGGAAAVAESRQLVERARELLSGLGLDLPRG
jgi:hypothetical protein